MLVKKLFDWFKKKDIFGHFQWVQSQKWEVEICSRSWAELNILRSFGFGHFQKFFYCMVQQWAIDQWLYLFQFCTILGTMIVPFGFLTVWEMSKSLQASFFTALLLICGKFKFYIDTRRGICLTTRPFRNYFALVKSYTSLVC